MAVMHRIARRIGFRNFARVARVYPPYLGAGVRVVHAAEDASRVEVRMPLTFWNQNFVGTQFGGSLYAMCDPFFMIMLMTRLGRDFVVWDKAASIEFLRPGRGGVRAVFELPDARVEQIRREVDALGKVLPTFEVTVTDDRGEAVARVTKTLHVRRKRRGGAPPPASDHQV